MHCKLARLWLYTQQIEYANVFLIHNFLIHNSRIIQRLCFVNSENGGFNIAPNRGGDIAISSPKTRP